MAKINPYILLIIQWIRNPKSVSIEELKSNYEATKSTEAEAANYYAYYASGYAIAAADIAATEPIDARLAATSLEVLEEKLSDYFSETQEDRGAYESIISDCGI